MTARWCCIQDDSLDPCQVALLSVCAGSDDLAVQLLKLLEAVTEGDDLSGTYKGEILWGR